MKKLTVLLLILFLGLSLVACSCSKTSSTSITDTAVEADMFVEGDTKVINEDEYTQTINLSELTSDVTITKVGNYHIIGESNNYSIIVNNNDTKNIHLILDNVVMTNNKTASIYIINADKCIIHLIGENIITTTFTQATNNIDAAIYSKSDLVINGEGSLAINSKMDGIDAKDDLKLVGGNLYIDSINKAIDANDSVRIKDAYVELKTYSADGIHLENDDNNAFFYMESGTLKVNSYGDAVDASTCLKNFTGYIKIVGGSINLTTGRGSNTSTNTDSAKGLKSDNTITIAGGNIIISAYDDAIHAAQTVGIAGGTISLTSSDDAIHSDTKVVIQGGIINASAHEGVEGKTVEINGGNTTIISTDDGINASNNINVTAGFVDITMGTGDVDGIDSNGTYTQSGGYVISRVANGNAMMAALDTDGKVEFTGGTFIALGAFTGSQVTNSIPLIRFGSTSFGGPRTSQSSSTSFASGTYTVEGTSITFTLKQSYSALAIVSSELSVGNTYNLLRGETVVKTWSQSSLTITKN